MDDGSRDTSAADPPFDPNGILDYNLAKYPEMIAAALSCGPSNRQTAKLINALFVDLKLDLFVSIEKVRGLKKKYLQELNQDHENNTKALTVIGVDGKNGMVKLPNCQSKSMDKQSMTNSITGDYLDHDCPPEGTGEGISKSIHNILLKYQSVDTILALNMDGCKTNTGCHSGVLRYLETRIERPLTWIICSLHLVEKVFQNLFKAIGKCIMKIILSRLMSPFKSFP